MLFFHPVSDSDSEMRRRRANRSRDRHPHTWFVRDREGYQWCDSRDEKREGMDVLSALGDGMVRNSRKYFKRQYLDALEDLNTLFCCS